MIFRDSSPMPAKSRPSWMRGLWIRALGTGISMMFGSGRSLSIPIAHGPDLEAKAYCGVGRQSMPFRDNKQKSSSVPRGYCFDLHTSGTRCQRDQCPYDHGCFKCGKKHPGYTWYNRSTKTQARELNNSPSHTNTSTATHSSKGRNSK